ncbi:hypothetical protein DZF91_19195 [Actinomadura logoneensis]|uniref:Bulb-type lectin domain-containing protein n=1 Tax=Actinomadura logoneensis TaxID=2293572 RepID=A0A372JJC1_9ACTN|nr:hypothetical protein [Actinomadura logoneensis]RFU40040.1 hypothetical protein DZF91_19195 [Actinomadura logoneensis]
MKIKLTALAAAGLATAAVAAAVPVFASSDSKVQATAADSGAKADASAVRSVLKPGQTLKAGQYLRSTDGRYKLVMQADGNLVVYKGSKSIWSSHTWVKGSAATMRTNGDLAVAKGTHTYWRSHTDGNKGAYLTLRNDGNAVVYKGKTLWSSYQWISTLSNGVTLYPYQKVVSQNFAYQLRQEPNGDLVLYRNGKLQWHTRTSGNPGAYTVMQTDGNLVVYSKSKKALWSTHTWRKNTWLAVQNDGNIVVYTGHMQALWDRYNGKH